MSWLFKILMAGGPWSPRFKVGVILAFNLWLWLVLGIALRALGVL
jgi:hypothetical protein